MELEALVFCPIRIEFKPWAHELQQEAASESQLRPTGSRRAKDFLTTRQVGPSQDELAPRRASPRGRLRETGHTVNYSQS